MNKEGMELEIKQLDLDLRRLRCKKLELETETRNIFNQKMKLIDDTINLKKVESNTWKEVSAAQGELTKAKAGLKDNLSIISVAKKESEKALADLNVEKGKIVKDFKKIDADRSILDAKDLALDREAKALVKNRQLASIKEKQTDKSEKKYLVGIVRLDQEMAAMRDKEAQLDIDTKEAGKLIKESKRIKDECKKQLREATDFNELLDKKHVEINNEKKELLALKDDQEDINDDLRGKIKIYDSRGKALTREKEELNVEKSRIEIKRLRVEKIIKDSKIEKDLKKLEDSLA